MKQIIFFLLVILFPGCRNSDDYKPLILATYTYSWNDRIDNLEPLANALSKKLSTELKIVSYPDVSSLISAILNDSVDIAIINTLGYLILNTKEYGMTPIATLSIDPQFTNNYRSVILSSKSSGLERLETAVENAKEYSFMFVKGGSTSGHLIPRLFLSNYGIEKPEVQFRKLVFGGDHQKTFNELINQNVDLCAVGSNEYFSRIAANPSIADNVNLLWLSPEIPLGPLLVSNRLSDSQKINIRSLLLSIHSQEPQTLAAFIQGWSEAKNAKRFIAIDDGYYDSLKSFEGKTSVFRSILKEFQ